MVSLELDEDSKVELELVRKFQETNSLARKLKEEIELLAKTKYGWTKSDCFYIFLPSAADHLIMQIAAKAKIK